MGLARVGWANASGGRSNGGLARSMLALSLAHTAKCLAKHHPTTSSAWRTIQRGICLPADQIDSRCPQTPLIPPRTRAVCTPFKLAFRSHRPVSFARPCFTHAIMAGPVSEAPKSADQYRLPTNVKPAHYDLTIRTDLKTLKFDGYVTAQCVFRLLFMLQSSGGVSLRIVSMWSGTQTRFNSIPPSSISASSSSPRRASRRRSFNSRLGSPLTRPRRGPPFLFPQPFQRVARLNSGLTLRASSPTACWATTGQSGSKTVRRRITR